MSARDEQAADGRSRRWDDHKQARRDRILNAAVEVLRVDGDVAGVQEIADRAKLPRSVVYRLFKNREDLDEQVRKHIITDLMAHLAPVLEPRGTVAEAFSAAIGAYVGWIVENPSWHQFLGTGSARHRTTGSRAVTSTRTAITGQVATFIAAQLAARGGDVRYAEPLAFAMTGMVDATVNRWLSRSLAPLTPAELSEFLELSAWAILQAHLQQLGVELTLDTPLDASE